MIGWSSYLMSRIMVTTALNVHYYERYVNLGNTGATMTVTPWKRSRRQCSNPHL
jgi:hypothetical protein